VTGERLWAPWRMEYIEGPKDDECIFCARRDYVVAEGERCFVMLNAYPYTNGHVMVSPYEHVPSLEQLDDATLLELMTLVRRSLGAIRDAYGPEGFNIGVNEGKVAGAGIEEHVHMHVVPRWGGDTNFMPVTGGVRVLPQSLEESQRKLARAFER
jgi:ATP adenylyltransferase